MFCDRCGQQIDDESRFCRHCGKSWRQPAPPVVAAPAVSVQPRTRNTRNLGKGIIAACILLMAGALIVGTGSREQDKAVSDYGRTKIACYCAKSYDDIYPLLTAYQNEDVAALYGLIVRGQALSLDQGVKVHKILEDHGVIDVSIESGFHSGETCNVPYRFIEWSGQ